jgi:hypothetical protein
VTVTVNPGGGMTALSLSAEAKRIGHRQLASLILTTYNQAAAQTMEIMSSLVGQDSEAPDVVRRAMPELPATEQEERLEGFRRGPRTEFDDEEGFQGFHDGGDRRWARLATRSRIRHRCPLTPVKSPASPTWFVRPTRPDSR